MVLVNLKPAKLAGVLSEGMLLCAEDAEGNLALMTPEKRDAGGGRNLLRLCPTACNKVTNRLLRERRRTQ